MIKKALACTLFLGSFYTQASAADDTLARFKGGIGVLPASSGAAVPPTLATASTVENVNRNIVRGVQPAGQIWVIRDLRGEIRNNGRIQVHGRGLLLGGGNNIGLNANASVYATLICGTAPNFTQHSSDFVSGVPLSPNGDFRIDDTLDSLPAGGCENGVLLIRNRANQSWFAAGIPHTDHDD